MRKNRVVHILASNSFSGAEKVSIDIIKEFNELVDIAYCSPKGKISELLAKKNINYLSLNKLSFKEVKKMIRDYNPDIIHAHDFRASVIVGFTRTKAMKISHIHQNPEWSKKWNLKTILYFLCSLFIDKIVFVSRKAYEETVYKNLISYKTSVITNCINNNEVMELSKLEKSDERFDIAFLGRLSDEKDPLRFINIVNKLKLAGVDCKSVMIGDGPLRLDCEKLIIDLNLVDEITLVGFQNNPYSFLSSSKILIMPSKWEGYGLAAIEALTLGIPIITTYTGGLVDINDEKVGGFFDNDNEAVIKVKELINNEEQYKYKSENSISKSLILSDHESWIDNIMSLYDIE